MPTLGRSRTDASEVYMAKRKPRREEWRPTARGWTRSFGERGLRVRLFQKRKEGKFYRSVWRPGLGINEKCLYTTDRDEAERTVRELLAKATLGEVDERPSNEPITLRYLLDRYSAESATYLDNSPLTRKDSETRVKVLCAYFGAECDVRELREDDVVAYTRWRLAGKVQYDVDRKTGKPKLTRVVRTRSVEADLKLLYAALKWATSVRVGKGRRLLDFHPLQGIRRPREKNPKRPITTWERFEKARRAAKELRAEAEARIDNPKSEEGRAAAEADRVKWLRAELGLVLLEATGRRSGSIRQLRWEDINFNTSEITWRAEADKKRQQWVTPIPVALLEEIRSFRSKLSVVAGWLFPAEKTPQDPMRRDVFARWILALEQHAGLSKLDGGLLHAYRRKWATERKDLSVKDVAAAGGWRDVGTLLTCYQQADRETMLAVMSEPRKVTEASVTGTGI
jgi:integrase